MKKGEGFFIPNHFKEFIKEAERFHGFTPPGLLVGGLMVQKAKKQIPPGVLYEALCETSRENPAWPARGKAPMKVGKEWRDVMNRKI